MKHVVLRRTALSVLILCLGIGTGKAYAQKSLGAVAEPRVPPQVTAQFVAEPGMLVEIVGLGQWTPAMLRDSLRVHARGLSLISHRVSTVLQEALGFPEAFATRIPGDSGVNVFLAVIEPQASARVRRRAVGADTTRSLAPWSQLIEVARTDRDRLAAVLAPPIYARVVGLPPSVPLELRPDSVRVRRIWAALAAHRTADDAATAKRLLVSSPNVYDRLAAVAILSNFEHDDTSWHAAVGALRDPDERVRMLAHNLLRAFTAYAPRRVDWRPAAAELRAVLNGTALFAVPDVLDMLVTTGVEPELAGALLHEGGHAVLMFAGATSPRIRQPSYRFLRTVSGGQRHGAPAAWRDWIAGLRP